MAKKSCCADAASPSKRMRSASVLLFPAWRSLSGRVAEVAGRGPRLTVQCPWQLGAVGIGQAAPGNAPAFRGFDSKARFSVLTESRNAKVEGSSLSALPTFPVSMATSSEITNPASITQRYEALVAAGTIEGDPSQIDLVRRLDGLAAELGKRQNGNGLFGFARLLGFGNGNDSADAEKGRGLYIWGPVGRGKTMLMDLFF